MKLTHRQTNGRNDSSYKFYNFFDSQQDPQQISKLDSQTDGRKNKQRRTDRLIEERTNRNGQTDGWTNRDGQTDRWQKRQTDS